MSTVCFVNGYVLSDEHPRFEKKNVLCENGKIKSIFSEGVKPLADTYVDIEGRYLVPGFTEGLKLMKAGGKYRMFIPAHLGYGKENVQGVIPGNSALDFTVELINVIIE